MEKHTPTSYRLSTHALQVLKGLAATLGISQRAALEIAIRGQAKREGITHSSGAKPLGPEDIGDLRLTPLSGRVGTLRVEVAEGRSATTLSVAGARAAIDYLQRWVIQQEEGTVQL